MIELKKCVLGSWEIMKGTSMKTGKIIAGVAAVLMGAVSPAFFIDTDTVYCEKVYDVKLSAETVEIDINDIPENREVRVGISIDNNPGFVILQYLVELDERLKIDRYFAFDFDQNEFVINCAYKKNDTILDIGMTNCYVGTPFYDNANLLYLKLKIPEDAKPGDLYYVKPFYFYQDDIRISEAFFRIEESFDSYYGQENFAESICGGIRITGQAHNDEPSQQPSTSQEQQPASSSEERHDNPVQNEQSGSQPEQQSIPENKTQVTMQPVTEAVTVQETTSVSTSEITTVKSTESTTVQSTSVSETAGISETVSMTEATVSESVAEEIKENSETGSAAPYIAGAFLAVAAAAVSVFAVKNIKKDGSK